MIIGKRYGSFGALGTMSAAGVDCPIGRDDDNWFTWKRYCDCMYPAGISAEANKECKAGLFPPWTVAGKIGFLNSLLPSPEEALEKAAGVVQEAITPQSESSTAAATSAQTLLQSGAIFQSKPTTFTTIDRTKTAQRLIQTESGAVMQPGANIVVADEGLPRWVAPVGLGAAALGLVAMLKMRKGR